VTATLPDHRELDTYRGLARTRPGLALALLVALLGLVGTPPTAVFVGKLAAATAVWDGGHGWLALIVMINSLLSLFYYLRWLGPAFAPPTQPCPETSRTDEVAAWPAATAAVAATASLGLGIGAGFLWAALDGPSLL
jgi:NADH-quinone oxidoreductase subunit N